MDDWNLVDGRPSLYERSNILARRVSLPLAVLGAATVASYVAGQEGATLVERLATTVNDANSLNDIAVPALFAVGGGLVAAAASRNIDDATRNSYWRQDAIEQSVHTGLELQALPQPQRSLYSVFNGALRSVATTVGPALTMFAKDKHLLAKSKVGLDSENVHAPLAYAAGQTLGYAAQAAIVLDLTVGKL